MLDHMDIVPCTPFLNSVDEWRKYTSAMTGAFKFTNAGFERQIVVDWQVKNTSTTFYNDFDSGCWNYEDRVFQ